MEVEILKWKESFKLEFLKSTYSVFHIKKHGKKNFDFAYALCASARTYYNVGIIAFV